MLVRSCVLAAALVGMTLLPTSLPAQRPQARDGFWISFGVGAGSLSWDCDGCANDEQGGPTGFIRLGGTPSKQILLGAEVNAWSLDVGAADIRAGYTAFTVYWYPSATGALFVKGGLGGAVYERQTATSNAFGRSGAISLGTGYDIRVGRMISITPILTLWSSSKADLKDNGATVETGFRHSGGTLQLGITFH